ncbi:RCC1 domain-containing protein [Catellatospora methionotrophica]|uniref:RCC1 domain-containing protein n=1 Tax=Catellatospora methionotrophica TaxID=121620 RepID=UPI0033E67E70
MRPVTTGLRALGVVAVSTMIALAAPHAAGAAGPQGGGSNGGGHGKPKPAPQVPVAGVESWGFNDSGQLGDGTLVTRPSAVSAAVPDEVRDVEAGGRFSLALLHNGTVKAWGANSDGQLGDGTTINRPIPGSVPNVRGVRALAAGGAHSLALLANGTVLAWGDNARGQLGDGTVDDRTAPVAVTGLAGRKVVGIAAGSQFSLALLADGTLRAWGDNRSGQLGTGAVSPAPQTTPVTVSGLTGVKVKQVDAGDSHALAVLGNGTVRGWGENSRGQVGNGTASNTPVPTPTPVAGLTGVKIVNAGGFSSLAIGVNGRVKGWGANGDGQLGDGTTVTPRPNPVDAVGLTGVVDISTAGSGASLDGGFTVAISNGVIKAWGDNSSGQVGIGFTGFDPVLTPATVVTGLDKPKDVSVGFQFALAT